MMHRFTFIEAKKPGEWREKSFLPWCLNGSDPSPRRKDAIPSTMEQERLAALDMLRAVAALMVVFHHVLQVAGSMASYREETSFVAAVGPFCSAGVDLFFVISGFVIANSISTKRCATAGRFLIGRAFRIMPLFWLFSLAYGMQSWAIGQAPSAASISNSITLIPMSTEVYSYPVLYVGWSLGFELAFYLLAAMSLMVSQPGAVKRLLLVLVILATSAVFLPVVGGPVPFFINTILGEFALGMVAWLLWRRGVGQKLSASLICLGTVLLLSGLFIDVGQGFETDPVKIITNETSVRRLVVWGIPSAMIVLGCTASALPSGLLYRGMARMGEASYSLYLIHPVVLSAVPAMGAANWAGGMIAFCAMMIGCSIVGAFIGYFLIERRMIFLHERFSGRPQAGLARQRRSIQATLSFRRLLHRPLF